MGRTPPEPGPRPYVIDIAARMMWNFLHAALRSILEPMEQRVAARLQDLQQGQADSLILLGKLHAARVATLPDGTSFGDAEFKVFSQWGEDGIIQYLLRRVETPNRFFVEFGVQNYVESNTRFLLLNDNWSGLVLDGSEENIGLIRRDPIFWRHELDASAAFVTAENINDLLAPLVPTRDIGLLSIDIDGNDYWVWRALESVTPRIVIVEYNSLFGPELAVTVPYQPAFNRTREHFSNLYWGASLAALCHLARQKGYSFVGSNTAGNNAFFVRDDCVGRLRRLAPGEGYVRSKFRESRDQGGNLTYISGDARLAQIASLQVFDVRSGNTLPLQEVRR